MAGSGKKTEEVYRWLMAYIDENKFSGNLRLPSENALCRRLDMSRETVRAALDRMAQEGLVRHFTEVGDHVGIPILLYNVPSRTGVDIRPETYRILSEHPNIRGTKEAGGNMAALARTAALCGDGFDIYSGNDDQTLPIMALGGKGVISVLANIMPRQTHDMCRLFLDGKIKESRKMQLKLLDIMDALFWDVNPIPVKAALSIMGVCTDSCRLPLTPMGREQKKRLAAVMQRYGLTGTDSASY